MAESFVIVRFCQPDGPHRYFIVAPTMEVAKADAVQMGITIDPEQTATLTVEEAEREYLRPLDSAITAATQRGMGYLLHSRDSLDKI